MAASLPIYLSLAAIGISLLALWKTHFAPFSALTVAGQLTVRIYPIRSGTERWFIPSLGVPVSITNEGARPGTITGLRLRFHFPGIPIPGNCEFIEPQFEIAQEKIGQVSKSRFNWVDKIVVGHWMPFTVLPKGTVTKYFMFETRWEDAVIQDLVICTLQIRSGTSKWRDGATWQLCLGSSQWGEHVNVGTGISYDTTTVGRKINNCVPADLHKYTGSKEPIPQDGFGAGTSYLDYPDDDTRG